MNHSNPILRETKNPIPSGIHRHLITHNYQLGETFMLKDCNNFNDISKIQIKKEEPQYN